MRYKALEWWIFNENKKFTAASMQEAALLIRKELGNEAVILNSKKLKSENGLASSTSLLLK